MSSAGTGTGSILGSCKPVAFVAAAHPVRAKAFYRDTLGLDLRAEDRFALVFDANGTMLRVAIVPRLVLAPYTVLGWDVPDIQRTAQELLRKGVTLERFEGMTQDELGIWTAPIGAKIGWFKDPDGNILSITEF